ncbi:DUF1853 family protein [Marinospirillum celere]|nr:DUF1853 family protein [Marinospirillum celere]
MQTQLASQLQSAYLRDLLWLLEAPDLITSHFAGKPDLTFLGLGEIELPKWFQDLENRLDDLEAGLKTAGSKRLGVYHEALWELLLNAAPNIQLLGHHLSIRENKRTLGELDFIYRQKSTGEIYHLEVAIKYYLGLPQGPGEPQDLARWIGPAGLDSLAIKVQHSEQRQLPLSDLPLARQQLESVIAASKKQGSTLEPIKKQLALPGVLFYPWHSPLQPPLRASQHHWRGWWLYITDWPDFANQFNGKLQGQLLSKPHWLAAPLHSDLLDQQQLEALLNNHFQQHGWPLQLALFSPQQGWQRVFLVKAGWPQLIPLSPSAHSQAITRE